MKPIARDMDARIVLASTSPRRRELLARYSIAHDAIDPGVDDGQLRTGLVDPTCWVAALAYLKARSGLENAPDRDAIFLGADTVCVHHARLIGQPRDEAHARRILESFENVPHDVMTGVAMIDGATHWRTLFVDRAVVTWGNVGRERIEEYLASGLWRGKAGAYNLEERINSGWPIEYQGDATSIMGLPMDRLVPSLESFTLWSRGAAESP